MSFVTQTELRGRLARTLSDLYGTEVPAYTTLLDVAQEVNLDFQAAHPELAQTFGSIERVTAERHGAIRVGSTTELAQVASIFAAAGMFPVNFYDLRDAKPNPIPVVSTAFRPIDRAELAKNPFRVFTSLLVPEDRRFFTEDVERALTEFIARRVLFSERLLELAGASVRDGGLPAEEAAEYLELTAAAFALSDDPVDRDWYDRLEAISSVAADIGGVASTHINHLTPRVLDIDELYRRMEGRGITMIDSIQGPPRWDGPDLLLRQTSFKALSEPRVFAESDGSTSAGEMRVRFGEVEARGIALTPTGRSSYDQMMSLTDQRQAETGRPRAEVAREVWSANCPSGDRDLILADFAYFTFHAPLQGAAGEPPADLVAMLDGGWLRAEPIVYEDFLPRSAAGIFASNLSGDGAVDASQGETTRDAEWMSEHIGVRVLNSIDIYAAERQDSLVAALRSLNLDVHEITRPW
ncbi:VOC family protein [Cryobacterium sp. PH29-G1]|uniref:2-oxoadipate dioxygenase/decarboxylase n=1 Tax=Cryobacterium sp. PH29-G1 TaxID=3046211 RepID=UPI0024BAE575|nr:VOC family protein [Cryobacterium sp. PH29-G1]MDJ0348857.1 VOC family protein [Cryobacterium sp. PH29-G1]